MKYYTADKTPANMFTKAKLKKMGLTPISSHSAFVTYPPSKRRYKLYKLENARPIDPSSGYSLLTIDNSLDAKQGFELLKRKYEKNTRILPE
jgi:hypothetical protein